MLGVPRGTDGARGRVNGRQGISFFWLTVPTVSTGGGESWRRGEVKTPLTVGMSFWLD